jgi:large subunit ribosomal protein L29
MKAKDLRERSVDDLRDLEKSLAKDVFSNRFKNFTNRLDDTSAINKARRDLARVKTLLREHAITGAIKAPKVEGEEAKPAPKAKKAAKPKAEAKSAAPKKAAKKSAAKKDEAK